MKVSDLTGAELDYWVAKAEGLPLSADANQGDYILVGTGDGDLTRFSPSIDWDEGGPIIERERISVMAIANEWHAEKSTEGEPLYGDCGRDGPTMLVAAMRCYVVSKFGYEVELQSPNTPPKTPDET